MANQPISNRAIFAGDEAGDVSFAFAKGASTHFVLALIATNQPDILRQALVLLRQKRGLPVSFEFKYHKLSSTALRLATFETLRDQDFIAWVLAVDKRTLPLYWRSFDAHDFYAVMATELILQIPVSEREGSSLVLDEFDPKGRVLLTLKRSLKRWQIHRGFRKMYNARSSTEPLVQVADLVAGAVLRSLAHGDSAMLDYIRNHIRRLSHFDPDRQKNPLS